MTDADPFNDPITEVDLALYAEGLLSPERFARVDQFLRDHPQLAQYAALWSCEEPVSENAGQVPPLPPKNHRTDDAAEIHAEPHTVQAEPHTVHKGPTPPMVHLPRLRRWQPAAAMAWKLTAAAAVVAIGGVSLWGIADARAIESTLSQTEEILLTDNPELSPQVRNSRIALEKLGGSIWLSQENSLRRDRLLASIYVTQAKLELGHQNQTSFIESDSTFPPLELCNQAINLVKPHSVTDDDARQVLVDAYQLRGQIHYLFGTLLRSPEQRTAGVNQKSLAADSLVSALEILPADNNDSAQRLQLGSLLFKTLHKGGLAGQLADKSGEMIPAQTILISRIQTVFPDLAGNTPADQFSLEQIHQFVDDLGGLLMKLPVSTAAETVAMMDLCNSCGLRQSNGRGTTEESVATFSKGLQLAETIAAVEDGAVYLLAHGRLLGNMADAYRNINQLDQEISWRRQALTVFRKATQRYRTEELFLELGWVTSTQLIAEYRWKQRHPEQAGNVKELLGALRQISNDLASLNGYQLGAAYDELIYAIHAEDKQDFNLGRGAAEIAAELEAWSALPPDLEFRIIAFDLWIAILEDFQGNAYFQQLPEFQQVREMLADIKPAE